MSLARPLARLVRRVQGIAPPMVRAASTAPPTPSSSSSAPPAPSSSKATDLSGQGYVLDPEVHKSLLPMFEVPRSPAFPSHYPNAPTHKHINHPTSFWNEPKTGERPMGIGDEDIKRTHAQLASVTGLSIGDVGKLHKVEIVTRRVVNMTKKGKMPSYMTIMCAGDPVRGLVGIGRGRGEEISVARDKAFRKAVLSMDYVHKYENRTLWGEGADLKYKWGACNVVLRARPAGFGLQVPHIMHRIFTACGIRDASATIEGSRNPMLVANSVIQLLHGGFGPPGLGSGRGTPGRIQDKGFGMRSIQQIERERGRYGIDVSKLALKRR